MKQLLFMSFSLISLNLFAQKQTLDVISFTPPKGWNKETKEGIISYTKTDNIKKTWCRINILKSTASKGNIQTDYTSEWAELIEKNYKTTDSAQAGDITEMKGWKVKKGIGKFTFNNGNAIAILTTFSGFGKCASIVALTNSETYLPEIEKLLTSLDLKKPDVSNVNPVKPLQPSVAKKDGYTFTTTNFDDGWVSVAMEDWVEVTKENIKVLLHYPKDGTIIAADPEPVVNNAWNILVASRYSNIKNYKVVSPSLDYQRAYMGAANVTDHKTGKEVYVALFRKANSGWVEVIAPDKNAFVDAYGLNVDLIKWDAELNIWDKILKMPNYNKFAVASSDFNGTWTSDFSALHDMYNIYTGFYAATTINQSKETFTFFGNGSYSWHLIVVSGYVGNAKFNQAKSTGKITVENNWLISCSDIEGKPKKYHAYFSCIKGARLLHLLDAEYPGNGMYTVYGVKK